MFIILCKHSTLKVWFDFFFANHIVRDNVQIAWQAWDMMRVSFCMVGAAFREDVLRLDCHFAWLAQYLARLRGV